MKTNREIYEEAVRKYGAEEIGDGMLASGELSEEARAEFVRLRMQRRQAMSKQEKLLSNLLRLKYQLKTYLAEKEFKEENRLGEILKEYLQITERKQKELAKQIDIHPSRLNRIIKGKESLSKALAYRLEFHSGNTIPALYWWKLMQKEIEQEIRNEETERVAEQQYVNNVVLSL